MKSGEGTCYLWNETIANRGANEIDKCLLDFIRNEFNGNENNLADKIFYSDNCSGQNKNKFIACLFYYSSLVLNINTIRHKFLFVIRGSHTKLRRLYAFSYRTLKKIGTPKVARSMYCLNGYQLAKQKGKSCTVKEMSTENFFNFKDSSKKIGKNFNMDVNGRKVLWNDIKEIRVNEANPYTRTLKLRTSFNNTNYQILKMIII